MMPCCVSVVSDVTAMVSYSTSMMVGCATMMMVEVTSVPTVMHSKVGASFGTEMVAMIIIVSVCAV